MFCTVCGDALSEAKTLDVLITRYRCRNGHLFYRPEEWPAGHIPDPSRAKPPAGLDDRRLVEFWLSDIDARRELPEQLASVCRRLIDLALPNEQPQHELASGVVRFCFSCGAPAARFGAPYYETPYRCERGHRLWERGGHVHLGPPDHHVAIDLEPGPRWAAQLAEYWVLTDHEYTTPYVSPELRAAIGRLRPELGPPG